MQRARCKGSIDAALLYVALIGGVAVLVRSVRRRTPRRAIDFDVQPENSLQTLGLSEALQ